MIRTGSRTAARSHLPGGRRTGAGALLHRIAHVLSGRRWVGSADGRNGRLPVVLRIADVSFRRHAFDSVAHANLHLFAVSRFIADALRARRG